MDKRRPKRGKSGRNSDDDKLAFETRLRRRPPSLPKTASYLIEIVDWEWRYSFGPERSGLFNHQMTENRSFSLKGPLVKSVRNVRDAWTLIIPDHEMDQVHTLRRQPVGEAQINKSTLEAFLRVPSHSIGSILQMILAGQFKHLSIEATEFTNNEADVLSFAFHKKRDCRG